MVVNLFILCFGANCEFCIEVRMNIGNLKFQQPPFHLPSCFETAENFSSILNLLHSVYEHFCIQHRSCLKGLKIMLVGKEVNVCTVLNGM